MQCQKHPEYKAERAPPRGCEWCRYIWDFKQSTHRRMAEVDHKYNEQLKRYEKQVDSLKTFKPRPKWQLKIAKEMNGVIHCPRCLVEYKQEETLCQVGDYPEELFCPHCDVTVTINIRYDGRDDV
jgi:hypothetical protein